VRYRVAATRVVWEGGQAYVVRSRDVTERELAQRDLAVRERRFRALAENVAGVVYRLRLQPAFELEFVNDGFRTLLGYEPTEWFLDPEMLARITRPQQRPTVDLTGDEHVYGTGGVHSFEVHHADGHWLWVEDHHTPERDGDGELVAVQGIIFDITKKWETEQALGEALRKHEVAVETMHRTARVEQTLLQSVSHELRTPMAAALGFARMLANQPHAMNPAQQEKVLGRLLVNIERIEGLINRMLEFDGYARGDTEIERSPERLDEVVRAAAERVDMAGRVLTVDAEPVTVPADRRRIEHAVEALLHNVVVHTPSGTAVSVRVRGGDDVARIVVQDDGPGVVDSVADQVFEPFVQGPDSKDIANPGVGLGLSMVLICARLHGGDARHERVRPHGARFVVEFPVASDDATGPATAAAGQEDRETPARVE
jgi:PAS domain S-box-containing protein